MNKTRRPHNIHQKYSLPSTGNSLARAVVVSKTYEVVRRYCSLMTRVAERSVWTWHSFSKKWCWIHIQHSQNPYLLFNWQKTCIVDIYYGISTRVALRAQAPLPIYQEQNIKTSWKHTFNSLKGLSSHSYGGENYQYLSTNEWLEHLILTSAIL